MIIKLINKLTFAVLVISILIAPISAFAQFGINSVNNTFGLPNKPLNQVVLDITNWMLGFIIILSFLMIVYGGIRYLVSFGSEDETAVARKIIVYSITGLIIAGLSWVIVYTVVTVVLVP